MNIELIYPLFIFTGVLIILILWYLRGLSNRAIKTILGLIELNSKLDCDLRSFLPEANDLLKSIKIDDFYYRIQYLGIPMVKERSSFKKSLEKNVANPEYSIHIGIVPRISKGEWHYIYRIVVEILFMVVEMDILIRTEVINEAFHKFSRLQTFILHDAKNLAQFIRSLSYNVRHLETRERRDQFLEYLEESLPAASRRADKITNLLEMKAEEQGDPGAPRQVHIKPLLEELARYYKLDYTIRGDGSWLGEEHRLTAIFDTLLKNVHDKSLQSADVHCHLEISREDQHLRVVIADTGQPIADPLRVFQPFYSTKPGGLGIGLYQVKHLVDSVGGQITCRNTGQGVEFQILIPQPEPAE
jgi:signal transduction histidine kinase